MRPETDQLFLLSSAVQGSRLAELQIHLQPQRHYCLLRLPPTLLARGLQAAFQCLNDYKKFTNKSLRNNKPTCFNPCLNEDFCSYGRVTNALPTKSFHCVPAYLPFFWMKTSTPNWDLPLLRDVRLPSVSQLVTRPSHSLHSHPARLCMDSSYVQWVFQLFWEIGTDASQTRQITHVGWLDAACKYSMSLTQRSVPYKTATALHSQTAFACTASFCWINRSSNYSFI